MKKLFKSKILLAVLAVAVVASTIGAGTYSWFISTDNAAATGATANITASTFTLGTVEDLDITSRNIELIGIGDNPVTKTTPIASVPNLSYALADTDFIYPGEGRHYTINTAALASLKNDRAVVVKLDFSGLLSNTLYDYDSDFDIYADDIYFASNLDALAGEGVVPIGNTYYAYVPAGESNIADVIGASIEVAFGIIGTSGEQNGLMGKTATVLSADDAANAIDITVVQATPAAIADAFNGAITIDMAAGTIIGGISFEPPVID